jgi:RimJ/RimL family protein N-acetyltransferase
MIRELILRDVVEADLAILFGQQSDPDANYMAAFVAKDPTDEAAFTTHWTKILADETVIAKIILCDGQAVGSVMSYQEDSRPEVTYWIGKEFWGQGIATRALSSFLASANTTRPMFARVAKDNMGSRRVLEKCGFRIIGEDQGFANARGAVIEELVLALNAGEEQPAA